MHGVAMKEERVAEREISRNPAEAVCLQRRGIDTESPCTERGLHRKYAKPMRTGKHGQPTQFFRTRAERNPTGIGIFRAADVDVILMRRSCVFSVFWEHNSSNIPRMHERLLAEQFVAYVQNRRVMRKRVEGFKPLEFVQDGPISLIAFHERRAGAGSIHQVFSTFYPPVAVANLQKISPQIADRLGINEAAEIEIAVTSRLFAQLLGIVYQRIGNGKGTNLFHRLCSF